MFKKFHFLNDSPSAECVYVVALGYISYLSAEILDLSGVISVLFAGIMMNHYLMLNVSSKSKLIL